MFPCRAQPVSPWGLCGLGNSVVPNPCPPRPSPPPGGWGRLEPAGSWLWPRSPTPTTPGPLLRRIRGLLPSGDLRAAASQDRRDPPRPHPPPKPAKTCQRPRGKSLKIKCPTHHILTSPVGGSDGKESTCNAGDTGLIPGLGKPTGEGNDYPLWWSCLENSMDLGAQRARVRGIQRVTRLSN